jgi:RNA polymerase sigma factor (sigma-70 family)
MYPEEEDLYRVLARTPLLTRDQERVLLTASAAGRAAEQELATDPPVSPAALLDLHRTIAAGEDANDRLIAANVRLVYGQANQFLRRGLSWSDLVQEGMMGLVIAITKFDVASGNKLSTYAIWWIRQRLIRALEDQARTIRLPVHISTDFRKLQRAEATLGSRAQAAEIATAAGLPLEKVRQLRQLRSTYDGGCASLDARLDVADDTSNTLYDVLATPGDDPADLATTRVMRVEIERLLIRLEPRERRVLELRHGLDGNGPRTLNEVGEVIGITRERVRQIEKEALVRLRDIAQPLREVA